MGLQEGDFMGSCKLTLHYYACICYSKKMQLMVNNMFHTVQKCMCFGLDSIKQNDQKRHRQKTHQAVRRHARVINQPQLRIQHCIAPTTYKTKASHRPDIYKMPTRIIISQSIKSHFL